MIRRIAATIVLAQFLACAVAMSHLPLVIAAVTDGAMVLDAIVVFVGKSPILIADDVRRGQVESAIATARAALNIALRVAQGVQAMAQAQIDEAFRDFRMAYAALLVLVGPLGVKTSGSNLMAASPGVLLVPEPIAYRIHAK